MAYNVLYCNYLPTGAVVVVGMFTEVPNPTATIIPNTVKMPRIVSKQVTKFLSILKLGTYHKKDRDSGTINVTGNLNF